MCDPTTPDDATGLSEECIRSMWASAGCTAEITDFSWWQAAPLATVRSMIQQRADLMRQGEPVSIAICTPMKTKVVEPTDQTVGPACTAWNYSTVDGTATELSPECLLKIWRSVGCTTGDIDNISTEWKRGQTKDTLINDAWLYANMTDDGHMNACFGTTDPATVAAARAAAQIGADHIIPPEEMSMMMYAARVIGVVAAIVLLVMLVRMYAKSNK